MEKVKKDTVLALVIYAGYLVWLYKHANYIDRPISRPRAHREAVRRKLMMELQTNNNARCVLRMRTFLIWRPMENQQCIVTAQGRKQRRQPSAIVIQNSTITAHPEFYPDRFLCKSYLGRPWKEFSRTIIMESFIDDFINPEGWLPWFGTFGLKTCWYAEYGNYGPGAKTTGRVKWNGIKKITRKHALNYTPGRFIRGDAWILPTGIPYAPYLTTKP